MYQYSGRYVFQKQELRVVCPLLLSNFLFVPVSNLTKYLYCTIMHAFCASRNTYARICIDISGCGWGLSIPIQFATGDVQKNDLASQKYSRTSLEARGA